MNIKIFVNKKLFNKKYNQGKKVEGTNTNIKNRNEYATNAQKKTRMNIKYL